MIQLATEITVKLLMVWTTMSTTYPAFVSDSSMNAAYTVYRPIMCNQNGIEYKVTTGKTVYKGKEVEFELMREPTGETYSRAIDCASGGVLPEWRGGIR